MKTISLLFLMILITWSETAGPLASGVYRFALEDGLSKSVEFNATSDECGVTTGHMTFRDEAGVFERDPDGVGDERPESPPLFVMTATLDSLVIERNRAVMGGTVTDSNPRSYIGKGIPGQRVPNIEVGIQRFNKTVPLESVVLHRQLKMVNSG